MRFFFKSLWLGLRIMPAIVLELIIICAIVAAFVFTTLELPIVFIAGLTIFSIFGIPFLGLSLIRTGLLSRGTTGSLDLSFIMGALFRAIGVSILIGLFTLILMLGFFGVYYLMNDGQMYDPTSALTALENLMTNTELAEGENKNSSINTLLIYALFTLPVSIAYAFFAASYTSIAATMDGKTRLEFTKNIGSAALPLFCSQIALTILVGIGLYLLTIVLNIDFSAALTPRNEGAEPENALGFIIFSFVTLLSILYYISAQIAMYAIAYEHRMYEAISNDGVYHAQN